MELGEVPSQTCRPLLVLTAPAPAPLPRRQVWCREGHEEGGLRGAGLSLIHISEPTRLALI
eukprot:10007327-Alexandrium_andersonii.AAC.1